MNKSGTFRELFRKPPIYRFRRGEEAALEQQLDSTDRQTAICPILRPSEMQLDEKGLTRQGGYRYTAQCFMQIAKLLASGGTTFLADLAGMTNRWPDQQVNGREAIRIFNTLVELRFGVFSTYRIVRHDQLKLLDGLIGPKHRFLDNRTLVLLARDAAPESQPFYSAELIGRRMTLWFRARLPFVVIPGQEPYPLYNGVYLCNAESTGTSAHGTLALFAKDGIALGPYKTFGGRVRHSGAAFDQRLAMMLERVFDTSAQALFELAAAATALPMRPLRFSGDDTERDYKRKRQRLLGAVRHLDVPRTLAKEVLDEALYVALLHEHACWIPTVARHMAQRTVFDIFQGLIRTARRLDLNRRECLGHAAFAVLSGNLDT